jgi:hypothetical protein
MAALLRDHRPQSPARTHPTKGVAGKPMAALFLRSEQRQLSQALGSIGELKNVILHSVFEQRGFTDAVNTPGEVAGNRQGCRVSVLYLPIAGRNFWRVVACVSDTDFNKAKGAGDEVAVAIDQLKFL